MLLDLTFWRWQRYTAIATLPLVFAHVVLQLFFFGIGSATFANVSTRLKGGGILVVDLLLLVAVCAHAFLGLRSVLQDYARRSLLASWITRVTLFAFVATVLYGVAALVARGVWEAKHPPEIR